MMLLLEVSVSMPQSSSILDSLVLYRVFDKLPSSLSSLMFLNIECLNDNNNDNDNANNITITILESREMFGVPP